jgi:hypothetical protein
MTYIAGGNIEANDYNTFAVSATGMNELFADVNQGATVLPSAGLGYGQTALSPVAAGSLITASQWNSLFTTMRSSGTHQGTQAVPPLPASGPVVATPIAAFTNATTISSLISALKANKFNLAAGQTSVIIGLPISNPTAWTTSLVYEFQINFGLWDNARYFFNTGGAISINASYDTDPPLPAPTPAEVAWAALFDTDFPINLNWETTTASAGNLVLNPPGFYTGGTFPGLTTTYQPIYQGDPMYSTNSALIESKLSAAAGTNGIIDFRITLSDLDPTSKDASRVIYTINRIQTSGVIVYPGSYTFTSIGFTAT